jgi:outer membrane protein assembly factor BamE (lipoprotein component of BamABCDE complex)
MKVAILLAVLLSGCTTYNITDSSRTTIKINEAQVIKTPVKRQQPKVRDCVNPYQAEKKLCEGVK